MRKNAPESLLAALRCENGIKVCRECIGWLNERAGGIDVTPTLPVADMRQAVEFCEAAGFDVRRYDDGFAFVHLNGQSAFDLDFIPEMDPASNHAGCYIVTHDVDDWHSRLVAAGLPVSDVENKSWGMREFTLSGPSGSNIRIGRGTSRED